VVLGSVAMLVGIPLGIIVSSFQSPAQRLSLSLQQLGSVRSIAFDLRDLGIKLFVGISFVSFPRVPKGISANSSASLRFSWASCIFKVSFFLSECLFSGMTKCECDGERNQSFHI